MRILLVEDNRVLGEALRDHLEAMGHDTEWRKGLVESLSATMAYTGVTTRKCWICPTFENVW